MQVSDVRPVRLWSLTEDQGLLIGPFDTTSAELAKLADDDCYPRHGNSSGEIRWSCENPPNDYVASKDRRRPAGCRG